MNLTKEEAITIYDQQPDWLKVRLEADFGKETFKKFDYRDLTSFDDCCRACGTTEEEFEKRYNGLPIHPQAIALERLAIINEAINHGWVADSLSTDQYKWAPYFVVWFSGLGFSGSNYDCVYSSAIVGSRLCLESKEKSNHSGTKFIKYWEDFLFGGKKQ